MTKNVWKGVLLIASAALLLMAGGCKGKDDPKTKRMTESRFRLLSVWRYLREMRTPIAQRYMTNRNGQLRSLLCTHL